MNFSKENRNQEILHNLKTILDKRGLSQREFAALLNKKESEISRWFSGKFCVSRTTQSKIENVLQEPISSDSTFRKLNSKVKIGVIGTGSIARRFAAEIKYVENAEILAAYDSSVVDLEQFCYSYNIHLKCHCLDELLAEVEAIYIASPVESHYEYAKICLLNKKHVLCEMPFTETKEQAKELYQIACANKCVLMPALKTAYCQSFIEMNEIAKSGIIGEVCEMSATVTTLLSNGVPKEFYNERLLENATYPLLACFKLFGLNLSKINTFNLGQGDKLGFASLYIEYPQSVVSIKVGVGVKSEGNLVISGTKGYIYVPAPWWKMDYFEVRFENQNDNKKYFFPYEADGLRYEIQEFVDSINSCSIVCVHVTKEENLKILEIQNKILNNGKHKKNI